MKRLTIIAASIFMAVGCVADDDEGNNDTIDPMVGNSANGGTSANIGNSGTSANSDTTGNGDNSGNTGNANNSSETVEPSPFVSVDPDAPRFVLMGEPFYFAGTNLFWLPQQHTYGSDAVDDAFDAAQDVGLTVLRVWGFADGSQWTNAGDPAIIQSEPGVYNERALQALDYVIAQASEHDLKVIIPLVNYWRDYGGMLQYAEWAGGSGYDFFYTDEDAKDLYKAYAAMLLNRVNTVTGVTYKDDPTIMSWELANEANAHFDSGFDDGQGRGVLADWYAEMAAYIKSLDGNHLVSTGEEGFAVRRHQDRYSTNYTNDYVLRGESGTSFVENTSLDEIDFAGIHLYPDAWGFGDAENDGLRWITDHADIAHELGKPLIVGEYGNSDRSVYSVWLDQVESSDVAGSLVWELVPASRGRGSDMVIVHPDDTELVEMMRQHAATMNTKR